MVRRKPPRTPVSTASSLSNIEKDVQAGTVTLVDKNNIKKKRKDHIIEEIRKLQKSTKLLIPKAPFARLVREIIHDLFPRQNIDRIQELALEALQEAAEMYLVQFFEDAVLLCLHGSRVTLMQKDMVLLRRLRGRDDIINRWFKFLAFDLMTYTVRNCIYKKNLVYQQDICFISLIAFSKYQYDKLEHTFVVSRIILILLYCIVYWNMSIFSI